MSTPTGTTVLRYVGYGITLLSVYYVVRVLAASPPALPDYSAGTLALAAAVAAGHVAFPFLAALGWKLSVELVSGQRMHFAEAFGIYVTTNLAKYLPGNVMQYVSRNYAGARRGWPHGQLALGSLVEIVAGVVVPFALLLAFLLARLWTPPVPSFLDEATVPGTATLALVAAGVALAALLALALRSRLVGVAPGLRQWWRAGSALGSATRLGAFLAKVALLSLIGLVGSTALFCVIASMFAGMPVRAADFFDVGCSLTLAGYAAVLTPGVPGGLGVKESASIVLLSAYGYDPASLALALVLSRVFSIAGDALAFAVALPLARREARGG